MSRDYAIHYCNQLTRLIIFKVIISHHLFPRHCRYRLHVATFVYLKFNLNLTVAVLRHPHRLRICHRLCPPSQSLIISALVIHFLYPFRHPYHSTI